MDETAIHRVVNFSNYLKSHADVVLEQWAVVSLDTWTLYEIEEAFSLIFEVEKYTNFHVLPPNNRHHPAIPQIQFLYDILQKVKKLRILSKPDYILPIQQQINLKCFRNLCYLELDSIPVNQLKGLQNVRPFLKYLTVTRVCSQISDILLRCGGDNSTEYAWENLEQAIFSRNNIFRLESSLRLLPAIKILDLSYCQLVDAVALFCLPTVSILNLSYNKLTSMPALSENSSNSLVSLNLSNNMIIDLRGIERFTNLEELNLRENFISIEQTLLHLTDLPQLKYLNLLRNPVTCGLNYRVHILRCLNAAIKYCEEFRLDDSPLLFSERKVIGEPVEPTQVSNSSSELLKFLMDKVNKLLNRKSTPKSSGSSNTCQSSGTGSSLNLEPEATVSQNTNLQSNLKVHPRRKSRKNQTRHVSISDPNDSNYSYLNFGSVPSRRMDNSFSGSPGGAGPPVKSLLKRVSTGSPSAVEFDVPRDLPSSPPVTEEPSEASYQSTIVPSQSDKLLEEILNSHTPNVKVSATDDEDPMNQSSEQSPNADTVNMDSSMVSSSNSSFYKLNDSHSRELSPINTDDEDLEPNRELYTVIAKWESKPGNRGIEVDSDFVFLSFTKYFYKEKDGLSGGTLVKLNISSLQNLEVLSMSPFKVQLHFSHSQPELRTRRFILEDEDYRLLKELVEPIIEKNIEEDEPDIPLPCKVCGLPFYGIKAQPSSSKESTKFCKHCGNKKREMTDSESSFSRRVVSAIGPASLSKSTFESDPSGTQSCKNANLERRHKREKSVLSSDNKWVEQESPMAAVTNSDVRTPPNGHRITDADTENELKFSSATDGSKEPTTMQESSSSGSMTGSVCTAVDRLSSGPGTPLKQKNGHHEEDSDYLILKDIDESNPLSGIQTTDDGQEYLSTSAKSTDTVCHRPISCLRDAFERFADEEGDYDRKGIEFVSETPQEGFKLERYTSRMVHCYGGYSIDCFQDSSKSYEDTKDVVPNPISYSYEDFASVDHRLKLFCELFLFTESYENLQGLAKSTVLIEGSEPFRCLVAVSNQKVYIIRITDAENGDSPKDWLEVELSCFLSEVDTLYTVLYKQGFVISMKDKNVFVCLADSERTTAFLYFFIGCLERMGIHPNVEHDICRVQLEEVKENLKKTLSLGNAESLSIHLFQVVTLLHEDGICSNNFLVLTNTHSVLFEANLHWLLPRNSSEKGSTDDHPPSQELVVTSVHPLDDLTHINAYADTLLQLDYYDHRTGDPTLPWILHLPTPWVGCNILQTLRPLWSTILKIDLQMCCYTENLLYLRQIFKDTPYAPYLH